MLLVFFFASVHLLGYLLLNDLMLILSIHARTPLIVFLIQNGGSRCTEADLCPGSLSDMFISTINIVGQLYWNGIEYTIDVMMEARFVSSLNRDIFCC